MKRSLYLATCDITRRSGEGLACLAYYNAFKKLFFEQVDLAMTKEYCLGEYDSAIKMLISIS